MTDYVYIIKACVIKVKLTAGTYVTCAVGQGGEVRLDITNSELFGQESVLRQDAWTEFMSPKVRISHAKFDGSILGDLLGTTSSGFDISSTTKTGYTTAYITGATYDHPQFDVQGTFKTRAGTEEMAFRVTNVMFSNLALPFPREGNIVRNLEGSGENLRIHYTTPT